MKVTFRLNKRIARNCLGKKGLAEDWVQSLSKYLSNEARLDLSVVTNKLDNDASLLIRDKGLELYASSTKEDMADAIDSVVMQCATQLVRNKTKNISKESIAYDLNNFEKIDEKLNMDSNLLHSFEIVEAENKLSDKKQTPRYERVTSRYVDYLYSLEDIDAEIAKAEEHLSVLYYIFETQLGDMLDDDVRLLIDSINELQKEINAFSNVKKNYKMNIRDERYINQTIDEELHLLELKRQ